MLLDAEIAAGIAAVEDALQWRQFAGLHRPHPRRRLQCQLWLGAIIGPHGFFPGDDFLLGLLMLGPDRHYPDHYHPAPELYWPLTAESFWSRDGKSFRRKRRAPPSGTRSVTLHATITGEPRRCSPCGAGLGATATPAG